ncbi:MAG: hypothetical protein ABR608_12740 [Pseudonocardiaceae bacterium]
MGATWTVELRLVDDATGTSPVVEWICSGVPTELPAPNEETAGLLGDRGLLLFPDDPTGPAVRTRCRLPIGYVTPDPDVLRLALMITEDVDRERTHPMVLAARWIEAGYAVDAAASWVAAGVTRPGAAQTLMATELASAGLEHAHWASGCH